MRLVFLDTETNDHPSKGAALRIVSITWLIARLDGAVEKIEDYIIRPDGFRIAYGAEQIHKISESHARKQGHPIRDVLTKLVDDLKHPQGMTLVCHNVRFDRDVIGHELRRHGIAFDMHSLPSLDTMKSTASICKLPKARGSGYKDPKLQELHVHLFGREFVDAHTSKADVEATARCFFELRRRGLFHEIGKGMAAQSSEQTREWLDAYGEREIGKTIRAISNADVKEKKPPPTQVAPVKVTSVIVKPTVSTAPASHATNPSVVNVVPEKRESETMVNPPIDTTGSITAPANKLRGWLYIITNEAMPGHVLLGYCDTDPILQANKLNGPGAPFPYLVAYAALMSDPRGGMDLVTKKLIDKKQSGKWYNHPPSETIAVIRESCGKQILYEDVRIDISMVVKQPVKAASGVTDVSTHATNNQECAVSQAELVRLFDLHRKSAEKGNADGQYKLGEMYALGKGVMRNMGLAVHWYKKSAEQGYAEAQYKMGCLCAEGQSFLLNFTNAIVWMAQAANQGHEKAIEWCAKNSSTQQVKPETVKSSPHDPELWEEVNTKLLLASFYLEVGDKEQAYDILQEVLHEGDLKQKAEAVNLLAKAD